jgi:hypothetical protein
MMLLLDDIIIVVVALWIFDCSGTHPGWIIGAEDGMEFLTLLGSYA